MKEKDSQPNVPAVDEACRTLAFLAKEGTEPLSLTHICEGVGIGKSKGFSILATLCRHGLTTKNPVTKTYGLGPGLLVLSQALLDRMTIRRAAAPYLSKLTKLTGATSLLGIIGGGKLVIVAREEAASGIGVTIRVGHRYPLDWGAHGELLGALSDESGAVATKSVIKRGFGMDLGKMQHGLNAVAGAIKNWEGKPLGCLLVVGTFPEETAAEHGRLVAKTAEDIGFLMEALLEENPEGSIAL